MENTFGKKLVNELRKFNKYEDSRSNINFVRNLRRMNFSNYRLANAAGLSEDDFVKKFKSADTREELNYLLLPFVERCVEILKMKQEHSRPNNKLKADTMVNLIKRKGANFRWALTNLEYNERMSK